MKKAGAFASGIVGGEDDGTISKHPDDPRRSQSNNYEGVGRFNNSAYGSNEGQDHVSPNRNQYNTIEGTKS
jgi:hypothetical protein